MPEQVFSTPHPVTLDIKVASGQIQATTGQTEESKVTIDGAERLVDTITVALVGDRLQIHQHHRPLSAIFQRFDGPLDIRVSLPEASRVEVATASAGTQLDGVFAGILIRSASGGVRATGRVDGDAGVETVSGDVRLPHVAGSLTVRSVSGDVTADSVEGSVSAKSVSGDVHVGSLREGTTTIQSVSGAVDLGIAPGTSVDVDAASASGRLSSEIPLADAPSGDPGPTVVIRGRTVSGRFRLFRAA
jgi:hypothetical protein